MFKKKLPIGVHNFYKLVAPQHHYLFVDKTQFIEDIINDGSEVVLITRPRRWGKTSNLSMLHHFFAAQVANQVTAGLFDQLKIATSYIQAHQGQYPVIFISFKDIKEASFESAVNKIKYLIQELYRQHIDLLNSDQLTKIDKEEFGQYLSASINTEKTQIALKFLSELLFKAYRKKVIFLIDEYDTPLNSAYDKYLEKITPFMKNLFSAALKDNDYLEKAVMTGVLRISKDSMLSSLNNLNVHTVLKDKKYAAHFGFTEEEVDSVLNEVGFLPEEPKLREEKRQVIKHWYNGYQVNSCILYNPWSILKCIEEQELAPYWLRTADDYLLKAALQNSKPEVKEQFNSLLLQQPVSVKVSETCDFDQVLTDNTSLWTLLLHAGYLTLAAPSSIEGFYYSCQLRIPNQEVLTLYKAYFIEWADETTKIENQLKAFFLALEEGDVKKFVANIEEFLQVLASVHDFGRKPEAFYHGFMLTLTAVFLDLYYIESNRESGEGRPDLVLIPKDKNKTRAIIFEFKQVKKSEKADQIAHSAFQQILEQDYSAGLKKYEHLKQALRIGLAFDGKNVCYHADEILLDKLFEKKDSSDRLS